MRFTKATNYLTLLTAVLVFVSCKGPDDSKAADGGPQLCKTDADCKNGKRCQSGVCKYPVSDAGCDDSDQCDGGFCNFITGVCIFEPVDGAVDGGKVQTDGSAWDVPRHDGGDVPKDAQSPEEEADAGEYKDSGLVDGGWRPECSVACDCPQGYYCDQGTRKCAYYAELPKYCCEKADCPAGHACTHIAGAIDFCAPSGTKCSDTCDCQQGMTCSGGKCVAGATKVYCCDKLGCPTGENCVSRGGGQGKCPDQTGWECVIPCDCMRQHLDCQEHRCVSNDKIPYCCDLPNCKKGGDCVMPDGLTHSTCMACADNDCDCPQGYMCAFDECIQMNSPSYCCTKAGCPGGADCSTSSGGFGTCKGSTAPCTSNCECPQGWLCEAGVCKEEITTPIYCCDLPICPEYDGCKFKDGTFGSCPKAQY